MVEKLEKIIYNKVLLSTQNICFGLDIRKIISYNAHLSRGLEFLVSCYLVSCYFSSLL